MHARRPWSPEEDELLRQCRECSNADLMAATGRTYGSVAQRRLKLGLPRIGKPKCLTASDVAAIRQALQPGQYGNGSKVARDFHIGRSTVRDIAIGRTWRHVDAAGRLDR